MLKLIITPLLIGTVLVVGKAQHDQEQAIGQSGSHAVGNVTSVTSTIGEALITTTVSNNLVVSEGFQQPSYSLTSIKDVTPENWGLSVYPNPAVNFLNIEYAADKMVDVTVEVTSLNGKIIMQQPLSQTGLDKLDISGLDASLYFVSLRNLAGEVISTYKITKSY